MFYERPIKYTEKDFKVSLEKKESELVCEIIGVQNTIQQYCFYLLKYGVVIGENNLASKSILPLERRFTRFWNLCRSRIHKI